jgi:hypothetical protein
MVRRSTQEINFSSQHDHHKIFAFHKSRMPIVKCACGSEILVIPDLKAMNKAINKHVAEHKKTNDYSKKLPKLLTEQVMLIASGIKMPASNY